MIQFRQARVLCFLVLVLLCFQFATASLIAYKQKQRLRTSTYNDSVNELGIMADLSHDALLKSDFASVRALIRRWGEKRRDFLELRVVSPNGFVIAEHRNPNPAPSETYLLKTDVLSEKIKIAAIYLSADYRSANYTSKQLRGRLFLAAISITTLLGIALWLVIRKTALAPMEKTVNEKTSALQEANHELEQLLDNSPT